jgi:hypothetical protein
MISSCIIPSLPCRTVDYIGQMAYSPSELAGSATPARFDRPLSVSVSASRPEWLPCLT